MKLPSFWQSRSESSNGPDLLDAEQVDQISSTRRRPSLFASLSVPDEKAAPPVVMSRAKKSLTAELKEQGIQGVDNKLLKELSKDNVDDKLIGEEIGKLSEEYDLRAITWRQRMVHFLHTIPVEICMVTLVIIDVLIILGIIVLDMYLLEEQLTLADEKAKEVLEYFRTYCRDCAPDSRHNITFEETYENLSSYYAWHKNNSADSNTSFVESAAKFDSENSDKAIALIYNLRKAAHILHYSSVAILALFVVEVVLKIIGYGKNYFKNRWELMDGIVIIISFALDVAVTDTELSPEVAKTILVVFLMWRIIRILNAMVLTSRARTQFRLRVLRKSKKVSEDRNKILSSEVNDLRTEVQKLRLIARTHGAEDHEIQAATVLSKHNVSETKAGLKNMMAQILHLNTRIASVSCTSLNNSPRGNKERRATFGDVGSGNQGEQFPVSDVNKLELPAMRARANSDGQPITRSLADWKQRRDNFLGGSQLTASSSDGKSHEESLTSPTELGCYDNKVFEEEPTTLSVEYENLASKNKHLVKQQIVEMNDENDNELNFSLEERNAQFAKSGKRISFEDNPSSSEKQLIANCDTHQVFHDKALPKLALAKTDVHNERLINGCIHGQEDATKHQGHEGSSPSNTVEDVVRCEPDSMQKEAFKVPSISVTCIDMEIDD